MRKKVFIAGLLCLGMPLLSLSQQKQKVKETVKDEEAMNILRSGLDQDPKFLWKIVQDESQKICSKYTSREAMPAREIQKVIELESKNIKYPQWGIFWGDWREGKKIVENARGGRYATYGFSDRPIDKGGNCYACHLIEKGVPGGTMGPSLTAYGKRYGITKENMDSPESLEKIKIVYSILYNAWALYPCSSMPRFGYHGNLSPEDVMNVVAFLLHPESPVNK
ncbi:sulfur oxidation c-type cytochrome SoxX [Thermocrinis sp.]